MNQTRRKNFIYLCIFFPAGLVLLVSFTTAAQGGMEFYLAQANNQKVRDFWSATGVPAAPPAASATAGGTLNPAGLEADLKNPPPNAGSQSDDASMNEVLSDMVFYASQAAIETAKTTGSVRGFLEKASAKDMEAWETAARAKNGYGAWLIGTCYENGIGRTKDPAKAFLYYKQAAERGFDVAENEVGLCYLKGNGVEKNFSEALAWFRKAAQKGRPSGLYNVGRCYENGFGVSPNIAEAKKWYEKAAATGYIPAQKALALLKAAAP